MSKLLTGGGVWGVGLPPPKKKKLKTITSWIALSRVHVAVVIHWSV